MLIDGPIMAQVRDIGPDLIFVNQGQYLGPALVRQLRELNVPIVNYTNDNPFSGRDGLRFRLYLKALPYYDLIAFPRQQNLEQAIHFGARDVVRTWFAADELAHLERVISQETRSKYASEVAFVGTWMPERGPFMAEIVRLGVPLSIWGDRWHKAPEWLEIGAHWRGPGIYDDHGYAAVIQSAKICLGMLSRGNQDLHTSRSIEIPALGGLLCAERTTEHLELYREGEEAVFWRDATECAQVCHRLLADEPLRLSIGKGGQRRALKNNHFNEPMLTSVLARAMQISRESRC